MHAYNFPYAHLSFYKLLFSNRINDIIIYLIYNHKVTKF